MSSRTATPSATGNLEASDVKSNVIAVISATLFFIALTLSEAIPEIPVDIDFKPFFIPLAFIAVLPKGRPTLAVALGAMLGEFFRDLLEGYEIDDPPGAVGYVLAFTVAGFMIGNRPLNRVLLVVAAAVSGVIQSAFEASAFLFFGEAGVRTAVWVWAGNTVTHGIIMGAIPLVAFAPKLHGRVERYLGFAPL